MKKLIAVLVVFALVAGAAIAQPSIGGQLQMAATILSTDSDADDINMGGVSVGDNNMHLNVRFGDDSAGGLARFNSRIQENGPAPYYGWFAFVWWKPVDIFRIQLGNNPDGDWGAAQIVGWGFTAEAKNGVAAISDYAGGLYMQNRDSAFYGGIGNPKGSINLSLYPAEVFTLNIGLPMADSSEISVQLSDFHLNTLIKIDGVGDLRVSFVGAGGIGKDVEASVGNIFANFYLTMLEAMKFEIGFKVGLPYEAAKVDYFPGVTAGLGFSFAADAFNFKLRTGMNFAGKTGDAADDMVFSLGILPSFRIADVTAFLHAGLGMQLPNSDKDSKMVTDWFVNPYLTMPAGALKFYAGIRAWMNGITENAEPPVNFDIQLGFNAYF